MGLGPRGAWSPMTGAGKWKETCLPPPRRDDAWRQDGRAGRPGGLLLLQMGVGHLLRRLDGGRSRETY